MPTKISKFRSVDVYRDIHVYQKFNFKNFFSFIREGGALGAFAPFLRYDEYDRSRTVVVRGSNSTTVGGRVPLSMMVRPVRDRVGTGGYPRHEGRVVLSGSPRRGVSCVKFGCVSFGSYVDLLYWTTMRLLLVTGHHYLKYDLDSVDVLLTDNDDYRYFTPNTKPVIKLEYIEIYSDNIITKVIIIYQNIFLYILVLSQVLCLEDITDNHHYRQEVYLLNLNHNLDSDDQSLTTINIVVQ